MRQEVHIIQLVKIQSGESLTSTPELNLTPGGVTYHREAKGKGYWTTTQVKVLSSEITIVSDADSVHEMGRQNSQIRDGEKLRDRRSLRPWHGIKGIICELGRPKTSPKVRICYDKPINGKEWQKMFWESDQFVLAKKSCNEDGAKGLAEEPMEGDTSSRLRTGKRMATKPNPVPKLVRGREVPPKSWMREICTSSSVRGFVVSFKL